ncbi:hypothetical protein CN918_29195 [Priestia megaterium]|nr:hypothetical protein CN918_29195 [Priestia megaterium]
MKKLEVYRALSGDLRIREVYDLSEEAYRILKNNRLPVYRSMSGSLNLRDDRAYTQEQLTKIQKIINR